MHVQLQTNHEGWRVLPCLSDPLFSQLENGAGVFLPHSMVPCEAPGLWVPGIELTSSSLATSAITS